MIHRDIYIRPMIDRILDIITGRMYAWMLLVPLLQDVSEASAEAVGGSQAPMPGEDSTVVESSLFVNYS
jgi:hypothetical protein